MLEPERSRARLTDYLRKVIRYAKGQRGMRERRAERLEADIVCRDVTPSSPVGRFECLAGLPASNAHAPAVPLNVSSAVRSVHRVTL